jgi:hypothetical protein
MPVEQEQHAGVEIASIEAADAVHWWGSETTAKATGIPSPTCRAMLFF